MPIPCNKKDKDHEAPDETLPSSTLAEYADMQTCEQTTNTPRLGANQSDTSLQMAAGSPNSNNMTSVNQASSTSQGTPHNDISNYEGTYL